MCDQLMKCLVTAIAVIAYFYLSPALQAAQLIMVEQNACEWCQVWNEEVGVVYSKTPEGKIAPLRRVDIHDPLPKDLSFISHLRFTPTFILVHKGKEFGRINGYPGEDFFWGMLVKLFETLPQDATLRASIESQKVKP